MEENRRIVLVPLPIQGHINPMMQLGKALNLKGFSITVALNGVTSSSQHFPGFQYLTIPESLPESSPVEVLGVVQSLIKLNNKSTEAKFKDCISQLLLQQGNDVACIIYDDLMYFCGDVAKEFNLPSIIFSTTSAAHKVSCSVLSKLHPEKFLIQMEEPEFQEKLVVNLHPLRYKDLPTQGYEPLELYLDLCREVVNTRTASAIIINTVNCLDTSSLSSLQQELGIPTYPLGPLHITTSSNSSLLEEDRSCIGWLNKQKPRSVIYISMGSLLQSETKEMLEMAWGLCNSNQPFLWVIRPGSVLGSEWIESFPEEISKLVSEKGYIVKWAPQIEVLGHPAVGGFWSHCGWNSTLESIFEGVPMICRPFYGEQFLNAMYIESVWGIGIRLEGEVERGAVERVVKRLFVDEDIEGVCKKAFNLKEKVKASVRSGGSSYDAFHELVKYLKTK